MMKKVLFCGLGLALLFSSFNVASAIVFGGISADLKQKLQAKEAELEKAYASEESSMIAQIAKSGESTSRQLKAIALFRKEMKEEKSDKLKAEFVKELESWRDSLNFLGFHKIKPSVTLPAFKIYKSKKNNALAEVSVMSGIGGGISFVRYDEHSKPKFTNGEPDMDLKTSLTFSPMTIILAKEADKSNIDLSYAMTLGFLNDLFMIGVGYDFGEVQDRSRLFFLLSIGANF